MAVSDYRADLDGLRAVAVLLVVLFHVGLGFPGGYVGVDVFFVISGYLITRLILRDIAAGSFSLVDFWCRRIRRIAPAALLMTLVVLAVGAVLLLPEDYEELGESAIAHPLMVANFFFWDNTDYFDGPADLKPLLHTWSLAVEEQFYLLFPLLLLSLARRTTRQRIAVLVTLMMLSLAFSIWEVRSAPSSAFFLLPSRAWELLLGGLITFLPAPAGWVRRMQPGLAMFGLAIILGVSCLYTSATRFPGETALLPCLGSALVIISGCGSEKGASRLLAMPPVVFLGRMSYSLYLWHWPILAFLRYRIDEEMSLPLRFMALFASFAAGYLSWRFVEAPLRYAVVWRDPRRTMTAFATATCLLVILGTLIQSHDGFPGRYGPELQKLLAGMEPQAYQKTVSLLEVTKNRLPQFGDRSGTTECLIWGDSHAMALLPAIDSACSQLGIHGFQATYGSTLPLVDFPCDRDGAAPEQYDEAVLDLILAHEFDIVIMAGYWSRDSADPRFPPAVEETIRELTHAGVPVVVVRDVPIQEDSSGGLVVAPLRQGTQMQETGITLLAHREQQRAADEVFASLVHPLVHVVDPTPYFVDDAQRCRIMLAGDCLYVDRHHISVAGAKLLTPLFVEVLGGLQLTIAGKEADSTSR